MTAERTAESTVPPSLLIRIVGCFVVFGSLELALFAPTWIQIACAIAFVDVFLLKRIVVRWAGRLPWIPAGGQLLVVLLVWPLIPTAWVWCALRQLTGSWIVATVCTVPLGLVLLYRLFNCVDRERQRAARGTPVPSKRRADVARRGHTAKVR